MKKILGLVCGISALVAAGFIGSCKINDANSDLLPAPSVELTSTDAYRISFAANEVKNLKYANIIRISSSDPSFETGLKEVNIGQVVPSDLNYIAASYMFEDSMTDPTLYYKYKIRYWNGQNYFYTDTNEAILAGKGTKEAEISGTYKVNIKLDYKSKVFMLQLDTTGSDVTCPADYDQLHFVATTNGVSRPFYMGDLNSSGVYEAATAKEIDLQKNFSKDFLDTLVAFDGLIAMDIIDGNTDGKYAYKRYYWTKPASITVKIFDATDTEGYYTDENGNPVSITEPIINIPSPKNPDNGFDFTANLICGL